MLPELADRPVPARRPRGAGAGASAASGRGEPLVIEGARQNNLKDLDVEFPHRRLHRGHRRLGLGQEHAGQRHPLQGPRPPLLPRHRQARASTRRILGLEQLDKVIAIDQSPIGRTPRSNPATYTNVFNPIRNLMAMTPEARMRGYQPGRFSFNVAGRALRGVQGGRADQDRDALPARHLRHLRGLRRQALRPRDAGGALQGLEHRRDPRPAGRAGATSCSRTSRSVERILETLCEVGLGYIRLGQPATTLSGGEAQRVKLSRELCKRSTGRTLYLLGRADDRPPLRRRRQAPASCSTAWSISATRWW